MLALYNNLAGLPFWTEEEIAFREAIIPLIKNRVASTLSEINRAWQFYRIEGPLLTPREFISPSYSSLDIFEIAQVGIDAGRAMRAETTASSYAYAQYLLEPNRGFKIRPPVCIWQSGKSFRQERSDGATAAKLRFNEFYQLEFQCIFSVDTKADYATPIYKAMCETLAKLTYSFDSQLVPSDRLPGYSESTMDVEVRHNESWREIASISLRKDFPDPKLKVLEIAIGLDRLVAIYNANKVAA